MMLLEIGVIATFLLMAASATDQLAAADSTEICTMEPEPGLCRAYFRRYYYNPANRRCEVFVYGGCGGNRNNFRTEISCRLTCAVERRTPVDEGRLCPMCLKYCPFGFRMGPDGCPLCHCNPGPDSFNRRLSGSHHRVAREAGPEPQHSHVVTVRCQRKQCHRLTRCAHGFMKDRFGCPTCVCNFSSGGPHARGVCNLEPEVGPCRASMPRWYYNPANHRCEEFIYGGCQGNENNFRSEARCLRVCAADQSA